MSKKKLKWVVTFLANNNTEIVTECKKIAFETSVTGDGIQELVVETRDILDVKTLCPVNLKIKNQRLVDYTRKRKLEKEYTNKRKIGVDMANGND